MSDNDEALTGATDTVGPWTIKVVSIETRKTVIRAAQIEGVPVGHWLERRVREWASNGSPVPVQRSVDDTCRIVAAACDFAQHRANMPKPLASAISRSLKNALPDYRVSDQGKPPPSLLTAP